jgi:purine-nucleoside phosphorylase
MGDYVSNVRRAAGEIRDRFPHLKSDCLHFCLTLGSGLSYLADEVEDAAERVSYEEIHYFPRTGVSGHAGELVSGNIEGVPLIVMSGRKHYYEVADQADGMLQVVFPVHAAAELGARNYFATNAAGYLNGEYRTGDAMVITDHLSFIPDPLLGKEHGFRTIDGKLAEMFTALNNAYDGGLSDLLLRSLAKHQRPAHAGKLVVVTGPSYETNFQGSFYRMIGGDAVGMSVTPEIIVAANRGMKGVGMSVLTNPVGDSAHPPSHRDVSEKQSEADVRKKVVGTVRDFFKLYRQHFIEV